MVTRRLDRPREAAPRAGSSRAVAGRAAEERPRESTRRPDMLDLQRAAGNHAVATLVVQRVYPPGDPTSAQVKQLSGELKTAVEGAVWKEIRKRVYPKESAAGVVRAKERKTKKRPDLTGLGSITSLERFAAAVHAMQKDWSKLTPDTRVKALWDAVNVEMTAAGVPPFLVARKEPMESKAAFARGQWLFLISEETVGKPALSDADAAELCNTTAHEARHAEQSFLAARFAAGGGLVDPQKLADEHAIPKSIAGKAIAVKFDGATDPAVVALGKQMHAATVVDAAKNQKISDEDGWAEMKVMRDEAAVARTTAKSAPTAANFAAAITARDKLIAQVKLVEKLYTDYRNIPYEADAHEVGDAAGEAFKGWK